MLFTGINNALLLWVIRDLGQYWKTNKSKWTLMLNYNIAEALQHIEVIYQAFLFFYFSSCGTLIA